MSTGGGIPTEALLDLRRRLDELPPRHPGRRALVEGAAGLYGVSHATVYRALAGQLRPKGLRRADRSEPRKIARTELERYFEIVAALNVRTSNLKRRRLSTANCIALLETHGVETADGLVRAGELRLMQIGATDRAGIATKWHSSTPMGRDEPSPAGRCLARRRGSCFMQGRVFPESPPSGRTRSGSCRACVRPRPWCRGTPSPGSGSPARLFFDPGRRESS